MQTTTDPLRVYSWPTPNGHKVHIMMLECGQVLDSDWQAIAVDIGAGDQFQPAFLEISPNNKIPALWDPCGPDQQPISVFESGACLLYLADKYDQFRGQTERERLDVMQWLMFQMGGLGPMLGQAHHFRIYAPEPIAYAVNRYTQEAKRLYRVLDQRLAHAAYVAGQQYSIADIAIFPWIASWEKQGIEWTNYPHLQQWFHTVGQRPAVHAGMQVLASLRQPLTTDTARQHLFGPQSSPP